MGQILLDPFNPSSTPTLTLSQRDLQVALGEEVRKLYGDVGVGAFGGATSFRYYDPRSRFYVVRTSRDDAQKVQFALTCMGEVKRGGNVTSVVMNTLEIAGSARTCKNKLQLHLSSFVHSQDGGDEERQDYQISRMEL